MERKHYECKECVNRSSPLCELCTNIISPSGKEHKPRYFVAQTDVVSIGGRSRYIESPTDDPHTEKLAKYLMKLLCSRVPIPTSIVLEYNRKTERKE